MQPIVLKISGHELNDPIFLQAFAEAIAGLAQPVVVVHGGGRDITAYQQQLGIAAQFVDGLRVTDAESLAIAEMVLCGLVNKRLVRVLQNNGLQALGISGVDLGMIRARKMTSPVDMGFTGEIIGVDAAPLLSWLEAGITPVIAPICLGETSNYNVNADHVAGALAGALNAARLVFISNNEGVLDAEKRRLSVLTAQDAHRLIEAGIITDGMIPKVHTALEAIAGGVARAVITNLDGLKTHGGTVFIARGIDA